MDTQSFLERCYQAGIRDPAAWLQSRGMGAFGWLKGAFPRGILPTDCDGEVEVKGQFLRLEFKSASKVRAGGIPKGQLYLFNSLIKTGVFTVFVAGHDDRGRVECCKVMRLIDGEPVTEFHDPLTTDEFHKMCGRWAESVDPSFIYK